MNMINCYIILTFNYIYVSYSVYCMSIREEMHVCRTDSPGKSRLALFTLNQQGLVHESL